MTLWREVLNDMFRLWYLAESDLLCEGNRYSLSNTGQGLNRVQHCPRVGKAMYGVLATCQQKCGGWVGSSVVHLGDHNVPNALVFIDKYSQVSRILNPIVLVIQELPNLATDKYVSNAKKLLLESKENVNPLDGSHPPFIVVVHHHHRACTPRTGLWRRCRAVSSWISAASCF